MGSKRVANSIEIYAPETSWACRTIIKEAKVDVNGPIPRPPAGGNGRWTPPTPGSRALKLRKEFGEAVGRGDFAGAETVLGRQVEMAVGIIRRAKIGPRE